MSFKEVSYTSNFDSSWNINSYTGEFQQGGNECEREYDVHKNDELDSFEIIKVFESIL